MSRNPHAQAPCSVSLFARIDSSLCSKLNGPPIAGRTVTRCSALLLTPRESFILALKKRLYISTIRLRLEISHTNPRRMSSSSYMYSTTNGLVVDSSVVEFLLWAIVLECKRSWVQIPVQPALYALRSFCFLKCLWWFVRWRERGGGSRGLGARILVVRGNLRQGELVCAYFWVPDWG